MAHTYSRKNFAGFDSSCNPLIAGAFLAFAHYIGNDDTVATIATAVAGSADAAALLPKGSIVQITSLYGSNEASTTYFVSANTGTGLTLVASGTVLVGSRSVNAQTGTTYTFVLADALKTVTCTNGSAVTVTIPPNADVAFAVGTEIEVVQGGAGAVTVQGGSGVTAAGVLTMSAAGSAVRLLKTATNTWLGRR